MLPKVTMFIWIIVLVLSGILILAFARRAEYLIAFVGAFLAAIFQIWAAYHARVSHFLECFSRCNKSYSDLNGRLVSPSQARDDMAEEKAIIAYFNLCAEEYLMHKMLVIPGFIWDVWQAGIHDKALDKPIQNAWEKEKKAECDYYGFDLEQTILEHHKVHGRECKNSDHCPLAEVIARASLAAAR